MASVISLSLHAARHYLQEGYSLDGCWLERQSMLATVNGGEPEPVVRVRAMSMAGVMFSETARGNTRQDVEGMTVFVVGAFAHRLLRKLVPGDHSPHRVCAFRVTPASERPPTSGRACMDAIQSNWRELWHMTDGREAPTESCAVLPPLSAYQGELL